MSRVMEDLNNQLQLDSFLTFQMGSNIPIHQQQSIREFHRLFVLYNQDMERNQKFEHHKQSYCRPGTRVSDHDYVMLLK